VRLRSLPEQNLRISVLHFKMSGRLCFFPGYAPRALSKPLKPLQKYLDVLLLATSSRVAAVEADPNRRVKADRVKVNGEECAWVPLNAESLLQQVTIIVS
jgi:hypothetical protein